MSPLYEGKNWRRTDVCLADGNQVVDVKLWGVFAATGVGLNKGDTLVCKNLHTSVFRGQTSLATTDDSKIEVGSAVFTVFT